MAVKKTAKTPPVPAGGRTKISSSVTVVNKTQGSAGKGAEQARNENMRAYANKPTKATAKALKAANKPTNKTGSFMNKLERDFYKKLTPAEQKKLLKDLQNIERAGLSKTTRNTVRGSAGRGGGISGIRGNLGGGGMNWQNK